jgi:hypothetical protein
MIAAELDNLWIDHDIDPDVAIENPMELIAAAPCFNHAATWVLRVQKWRDINLDYKPRRLRPTIICDRREFSRI